MPNFCKYLIPVLLITFFACNNKEKGEIPVNILSKQEMVKIMIDIQLLEATLSVKELKGDEFKEKVINYYGFILMSHNISKEKFNDSFKYYAHYPRLFDDVLEEVINELSRIQAEVENEKEIIPK